MAGNHVSMGSYEEDLQRLKAEERGKQMAYRAKMVLAWILLLLILALIFSGFEIEDFMKPDERY